MQMLRRTIVLDLSVAMGASPEKHPAQAFWSISSSSVACAGSVWTFANRKTGLGVTSGYGWWYGT
jgi:hypothetical protein